ncbi:MAG: SDR family NAD(P)-dependent oxidoreductase [Anaerolineales bacterium]
MDTINALKRFGQYLLVMLLDLALFTLAYVVVYFVRVPARAENFDDLLPYMLAFNLINVAFLYLNAVYRYVWSQSSGYNVSVIITALLEALALLLAINIVVEPQPLPMSVVFVGQALSLSLATVVRYRYRVLTGFSWRWEVIWRSRLPESLRQNARRMSTLVVGAGQSGTMLVMQYQRYRHRYTLDIIGYADDAPEKQGKIIEGKPVLGKVSDIPSLVEEYKIELVVIALHKISKAKFREILDIIQETPAQIRVMPDMANTFFNASQPAQLREVTFDDFIGRSTPMDQLLELISNSPLRNHTILVTGAAGSIGSQVCQQLLKHNPHTIVMLDNNESGLYDIQHELSYLAGSIGLVTSLCDITDTYALERVFQTWRPKYVFHVAAYKHVPLLEDNVYQAVRVNIGGTFNVVRLAQQYDVRAFTLVSTDKAAKSKSVMGATKYIAECIAMAYKNADHRPRIAVVRFGNVLGSRGSVIPLFEKQISHGGPVTVTDPRTTRYFMSISEAAQLIIQTSLHNRDGSIYLLEMGESVRILELAERLIRMRGLRPYIDIPIIFTGMRPGEVLHESLLVPGEHKHATELDFISTIERPENPDIDVLTVAQDMLAALTTRDETTLREDVLQLAASLQGHPGEEIATP